MHDVNANWSRRATTERVAAGFGVRGKDPLTGKQLWHRKTVRTEREAQIALGKLLEETEAGRRPTTRVTVAEAIARYLEVSQFELSTRRMYEGYIRRTILPALGAMELRKVRGPLLDTFYSRLRQCGDLACTGRPFVEHSWFPPLEVPTASRTAWQDVVVIVRDAIRSGQLGADADLPSAREMADRYGLRLTTTRRALEALEEGGFIEVRQGCRAVVLAQPSGVPTVRAAQMRHDCARFRCQPHVCKPMAALTIKQIHAMADLDLARQIMHVAHSYLVLPGVKMRKDTKTHQDRRLAVDDITVTVIEERRNFVEAELARVGCESPEDGYIFSPELTGEEPCEPGWVTKKVSSLAATVGVAMNVKSLRHYSASQLLAGGIDLRNTAARLGHGGGGATTLRHYADPVSEVDRRAAAYLAKLTNPREEESDRA